MKKRIITIMTILVIATFAFSFSACRNSYGDGHGDITVMGANRISADFWRHDGLNEIDGLKVWHQISDRGVWIDFTIVWIGEFSGLGAFAQKVFCGDCGEEIDGLWQRGCYCILETHTAEFFESNNLVLIAMMEGVLTTGMRVDNIRDNGTIDMTRTQFNDRVSILLGIPLQLSVVVDHNFTPTNMSINMRTNRVRR